MQIRSGKHIRSSNSNLTTHQAHGLDSSHKLPKPCLYHNCHGGNANIPWQLGRINELMHMGIDNMEIRSQYVVNKCLPVYPTWDVLTYYYPLRSQALVLSISWFGWRPKEDSTSLCHSMGFCLSLVWSHDPFDVVNQASVRNAGLPIRVSRGMLWSMRENSASHSWLCIVTVAQRPSYFHFFLLHKKWYCFNQPLDILYVDRVGWNGLSNILMFCFLLHAIYYWHHHPC